LPNLNVFAAAQAVAAASVVLIRGRELGNNCHFIADNYPGQQLQIVTPEEYAALRVKPTWAIRWGTSTRIDRETKVLNKSSAIKETLDKASFRKKAADAGLAPKIWMTKEELGAYDGPLTAVIVRPRKHSRSENLFLCKTPAELDEAINRIGGEYYISEYIEKEAEYRVFVVSGRVVMVFEKKPRNRNDVSWGCVEEGALKVMRWSQWPMHVVENAVKAFNLTSLDFGAADIMVKDGKAYFLEFNTAPEVWPYYGERLGEAFHYIISRDDRSRLPVERFENWKDVAHPTLLA
jgi:glutathione synthase/RimK-type ligase-like ATP-grasp enzyme